MNTMQTPELGEAKFYNNLPQTLEKAWSLLEDAARNRHPPMHTPVLVSSGEDHTARARTVVLRDTVRTTRELRIHTDSRSAKVEELHRQPTCRVLTYYPVQKIQLRLDATATIHQETTLPAKSMHKHHSPVAAVTSRKKHRAHAPPNPPPAFQLTLKTVSPEPLSQKRGFATLPQ